MTEYFPDPPVPSRPHTLYAFIHTHDPYEVGAQRNQNGTWSSLWRCTQCPDVLIGAYVGPIPEGMCGCGFVQREWPRDTCEDCGRSMVPVGKILRK